MSHAWRLVSVLLALVAGFLVPLAAVLVISGVADMGVVGAVAVVVLVVAAVVAWKVVGRRLRASEAGATVSTRHG